MAFGATLAIFSYAGFPAFLFGLGGAAMILPFVLSFGLAGLGSVLLARRFADPTGLTWYSRYGDSPAGKLLWSFMLSSCICMAGLAVYRHFPGVGDHGIFMDSPLRTWILERRCVDHATKGDLCTLELCQATRSGNKSFADLFCQAHPATCIGILEMTSLDWAMENCLATCGCDFDRDPFNPFWSTADDVTFECEKTGSCTFRTRLNSWFYPYVKYPSWIEVHIITGTALMLLVPLQHLKAIRMWKSRAFHRWNGRLIVLLAIPNQISAVGTSLTALLDADVELHLYTTLSRALFLIGPPLFLLCLVMAVYYVKVKRDIKRHGEYMMRATAFWFSIPLFRALMPFYAAFVGFRMQFPITVVSIMILPLACTEIYIRKAGRFASVSDAELGLDKSPGEGLK
eukprot:TRINITY_DN18299_c0_g1_i1.p1 TRINITY_DN18299_c0_g1~~TRINITY_DN18299_c0_g1_i1.p1  ORF type:complete len:435 (+),score=42.50 TRINITY_DN18299_c0_g1_i1:106-1305(+)